MAKSYSNKYINSMRSMGIQAIQKAGQGHSGMAISAAPITYTVFSNHLRIASADPKWFNRDRFVLSAGHGSMSMYPILCFAGLLSLDEIKNHKQENSQTPGHPEYEPNNHVDASTGPLGQGVANAVGMAIAQKYLENKFKKISTLIDHYTYVVVGDGDLEEGICYESMSLAGKLNLSKLIMLHDSNDVQLESAVTHVFNENLKLRMESQNWHYQKVNNSVADIDKAIRKAKETNKPSFIEIKTIIGEGLSAHNTPAAHGCAINDDEIKRFEDQFNIKVNNFEFDEEIYKHFETNVKERGDAEYELWQSRLENLTDKFPEEAGKFKEFLSGEFYANFTETFNENVIKTTDLAIRDYVKEFFSLLTDEDFSFILNGSADLSSSVKNITSNVFINDDFANKEIHYGIREFAMAGIQNGIMLHGGLKTVASTFLAFSDYMKSAIRLGTLMNLPTIYIFSHDSYCVGGDGPTHQPFDQIPMLRSISNLVEYRPCDEHETRVALVEAFTSKNRSHVIITTRQNLRSFPKRAKAKILRGGYILKPGDDFTLVASGSEVMLAYAVAEELEKKKHFKSVKVVSVPSLTTFAKNKPEYIEECLKNKANTTFCIEASSDKSWYLLSQYGQKIMHLGAFDYGKSMDGTKLYEQKGFNVDNIVKLIEQAK